MIIKQDLHHNVVCDQFIELINNAGTMLQCKGFRATKAYLIKEIHEAYFASIERELIDKKARPCQCFFSLLAFNEKMRSTSQLAHFLIRSYEAFKEYKVHYHSKTVTEKSIEKIDLDLFSKMLSEV